jgi:hypothetical protein
MSDLGDLLTQETNADPDYLVQTGRTVGTFGGAQNGCGLGEPWILWDTRNHDGTSMIGGPDGAYPYGDMLVNEGIGGDKWDLPIEIGRESNGSYFFFPYKTLNWPNSFGTSGTNHPTSWEDLGGNYCDAGGITYMVVLGKFGYDYERAERSGYVEGPIILRGQVPGSDPPGYESLYFQTNHIFYFHDWRDGAETIPIWYNFFGIFPCDAFLEYLPDKPLEDESQISIEYTMFTMHWDPQNRRAYLWINRDLFEVPWLEEPNTNPLPTPPGATDPYGDNVQWWNMEGDCETNACGDDPALQTFIYQGDAGPFATPPPVGVPWDPMRAVAMFRGAGPCQDDIDYWYDYFLGSPEESYLTAGEGFIGRVDSGGTTLVHTEPHSHTISFPEVEFSRIRIIVAPARGGRSQAYLSIGGVGVEFDCTNDDEVVVELGGQGGEANSGGTITAGAGGWPDGGDGGPSLLAPYKGGGGGGSTRIYKNGVLMAIVAGAGGGCYGGNPPTQGVGGSAGGVYGDNLTTTVGGNGISLAGLGGGGGTASGPGLAGGAGATDGSGSQGGDGAASTAPGTNYRSGGGGGGGGLFGGGGGGAGASLQPGGGGAGSHWFHPDTVSNEYQIKSPIGITTGSNASAEYLLIP